MNDAAAREFALKLYAGLIGVRPLPAGGQGGGRYERQSPLKMHAAMREARLAIASLSYGAGTWGAYQHYGNPYLQFFNPESLTGEGPADSGTTGNSAANQSAAKASRRIPKGTRSRTKAAPKKSRARSAKKRS